MAKKLCEGGICYVGVKGGEQSLYHIGPAIIAASEKDKGLLDIIAELEKKASKAKTISQVTSSLEALLRKHKTSSAIDIFCSDSSGNVQESHYGKSTDSGQQSLESLAECTQFGILSRQGAKALYSPEIGLHSAPDEYKGFFRHSQHSKAAANASVYCLLKKLLRGKDASSLRQELAKEYLEHDYGIISSLDFQRTLNSLERRYSSLEQGKRGILSKGLSKGLSKAFSKAHKSIKDIISSKKGSSSGIVVELSHTQGSQRQELAYRMERAFSLKGSPLRYADGIMLACPYDEIKRVIEAIENEFRGVLNIARMSAREAYPYFIPEMFHALRDNGEIVLRPIAMRKAPKSFSRLWNLENIGAYAAQKKFKGEKVNVAVVDTGADYNHDEICNNYQGGINIIGESDDPYDGNGHGTHVSGTICGKATGVAPSAQLYAVKVLSDEGYGSEITVCQGIEWCIDNGINVINMSLGGPYPSSIGRELCRKASEKGIMVVAAAGNEGSGRSYPASYPGVISVAAVDRNNDHAYFSNVCDTLDISAPGVDIYSSWPGGGYKIISGTSMASPHVAGVCCLGLSAGIRAKSLEDAMKQASDQLGDPELYGSGLVRADKLINDKDFRRR